MKVTEREEYLVQELNEYCKKQKCILAGVVYLGRCIKKIKHPEKNDPITVMAEHAERALLSLRMFTILIYDARNRKALFIEYDNVRYGEYLNPASATKLRLIRQITKFSSDYSKHLCAMDAVLNANTHDTGNRIFLPDEVDIPRNIEELNRIIKMYCD